MGGAQPLRVVQHVDQPEGDDAHHVRAERQQEQEEIAVVAAPDAVVDPGAVVVEVLGGNSASALGNPLQCSCLENLRDGGAWWAAVYGVTQSRTRLK